MPASTVWKELVWQPGLKPACGIYLPRYALSCFDAQPPPAGSGLNPRFSDPARRRLAFDLHDGCLVENPAYFERRHGSDGFLLCVACVDCSRYWAWFFRLLPIAHQHMLHYRPTCVWALTHARRKMIFAVY